MMTPLNSKACCEGVDKILCMGKVLETSRLSTF